MPFGLVVLPNAINEETQKTLVAHYKSPKVKWFQRFGKRFPKTAHYNGHHAMVEDPDHVDVLKPAVQDALEAIAAELAHPAIDAMRETSNVAVAAMLHQPGWGLGPHVDVFAPDGQGLVVMMCVGTTKQMHRTFRFSQPALGDAPPRHYDVDTPPGTVLVFHGEAYEEWKHESRKKKQQDGDCISLTLRLREIDGYDGWEVPDKIARDAAELNMTAKRYRSHAFAEQKMLERIKRRRAEEL